MAKSAIRHGAPRFAPHRRRVVADRSVAIVSHRRIHESTGMTKLRWLLVAVLGCALVVGGFAAYRFTANPPAAKAASVGGPFALVDGSQTPVTHRTYRGKWEMIYFGYTFCPDACPTALNTIAETMQQLGPLADRVQPIFITIDPRRDTPDVIGAYVKNFDPRIVGLTGSPEAIGAVAKEFRIYYAAHKTGDGPDDYLMDHSSIIIVMDPNGRFAGIIAADLPADRMTSKLRELLAASPSGGAAS
jgi:protein SCO1